LEQDHVQVRLFGVHGKKVQFLHAKAYIFDSYSIVGSSNFTPSGLAGNTELNIVNKISAIAQNLRQNWFEKFWTDPSVDLDYKTKLIDTLNASKFGSKPYTPYQVFLKTLYELFKDDSIIGGGDHTTLDLASFQQEGFERAVKLIEKHNGCIVADAVGLGKTYIGLRVLDYYLIKLRSPRTVPRALVICPAQLRDLVWMKKLDEFGIKADIVSQEEISRQSFDISKYRYHDIVIVDESHSFRNSATNRYRNLQKLLGSGKRNKRVLLLTATPINTNIFDLYHQISLLTRSQDSYYRTEGITNLKTYFKALAQGGIESTELLMQTMVRRSRQDVIRRQEAGEEIRINGQLIRFPKRQLEQFTYNFEDSYTGLYAGFANQIDEMFLAPYNIKSFKKRKQKSDEVEIQRNNALVALQKALYLKRLESSIRAFRKSVENQRDFQTYFYEFLKVGKLLDSRNFRKLLMGSLSEDDIEGDMTAIIDQLEEIDPNDYDLDLLQSHIESDLTILKAMLETLTTIQQNVEAGKDHDRKLSAFKELFSQRLKGQKVLVFCYYQETANYIYDEILKDKQWLTEMGDPTIELITGATPSKQREIKVKRFSPKSNLNADNPEELAELLTNPVDILISTDVLSEGQNLQDAGVLVNYSLHWNPVRMIQRAGRIDRLGSEYENLTIYNCFPEEGLESLLGLVSRLQIRIATIDREVGLDASVLGEVIQGRSLEELMKLKRADNEADKAAILAELDQEADLISLDEMRLPLLEFIQSRNSQEIEDIPLGIHSTRALTIPFPDFKEGGLFLAFRANEHHFWLFYPRIEGHIITDDKKLITDKRKIFNWLKCKESDYPNSEELAPVPFDSSIFRVLGSAVEYLLDLFKRQQSSQSLKPQLPKLLQPIHHVITQIEQSNITPTQLSILEAQAVQGRLNLEFPIDSTVLKRLKKIIERKTLKIYENDLRKLWDKYKERSQWTQLIEEIDEYFVENDLYFDLEESEDESKSIEVIRRENIKLICYEWFKPVD
jgi:superfamily II DNA or RNA helicase